MGLILSRLTGLIRESILSLKTGSGGAVAGRASGGAGLSRHARVRNHATTPTTAIAMIRSPIHVRRAVTSRIQRAASNGTSYTSASAVPPEPTVLRTTTV